MRETPDYRKAVEGGEAPAAALKRLKADRDFMRKLRESKSRLEAGFVAINPMTGEVKAWVGSRDFARDQFDHVAQAARQPGSTFKPFVYGAALENGMSPEQPYVDAVTDIRAADGTVWRPTDMSGTTGRQMTMRDGLVFSKNTITAQVMRDVGLPPVIKLAQNLGIRQSKLAPVPSLALGTSPVTLLEMVSGYSSIAAQGEYRKPIFVRRITDRDGNVIADFGNAKPERAMSQAASATLIDMLRGVVNRGTGTAVRSRFGINGDVAGKTGTTQNNADGWFILMHPNLVAGAWVGFNDNRVTMRSSYWGQGGHNAILLVGDFFRSALDAGKLARGAVPGRPAAAAAAPQRSDGAGKRGRGTGRRHAAGGRAADAAGHAGGRKWRTGIERPRRAAGTVGAACTTGLASAVHATASARLSMTMAFRHGAVISEIGVDVVLHSLLSTVAVPPTAANTCPVA